MAKKEGFDGRDWFIKVAMICLYQISLMHNSGLVVFRRIAQATPGGLESGNSHSSSHSTAIPVSSHNSFTSNPFAYLGHPSFTLGPVRVFMLTSGSKVDGTVQRSPWLISVAQLS